MKKIFLVVLIVLSLTTNSFATDYYAAHAGNVSDNDVWYILGEITGSCTATGTPVASATVLQAGNTLYANGCALTIVAGFTATNISTAAGGGNAGGGFSMAINTYPSQTITSNIEAGTTPCLTLTGNVVGVSPALTILGNITAGATTSASGVVDNHVGIGGVVVVQGNITGGAAALAHGYVNNGATGTVTISGGIYTGGTNGHGIYSSSVSTFNITGTCVATTGNSSGCYNLGLGPMTVTGDCQGSTTGPGPGCNSMSTGVSIVTGNIINASRSTGISGSFHWSPSSNSKYIKIIGDGSPAAFYFVPNADGTPQPSEAQVESGVEYGWDGADHYTGALVAGGGTTAVGF